MNTILDEVYTFFPEDDKTNFCVYFDVPENCVDLQCECSFSPKTVDDPALVRQAATANIGKYLPREQIADFRSEDLTLVNHLTFSLDFGDRYVGCAHRHAPTSTHIISQGGSSPGFIRQGATAGKWRAVINIHSITSPEVRYNLKISATTQGESANGV